MRRRQRFSKITPAMCGQGQRGFREVGRFGLEPGEVLERLYSRLGDWLSDVKAMANKGDVQLESYLYQCLLEARQEGRVRDAADRTAYELLDQWTGPRLLLFFTMKWPHCRDAFLRGELPPYAWREGGPAIVYTQSLPPANGAAENAGIADDSPDAQGLVKDPSDKKAYVAASKLVRQYPDIFGKLKKPYRKLRGILDNAQGSIRYWRPNERRRYVHGGDFADYIERKAQATHKALVDIVKKGHWICRKCHAIFADRPGEGQCPQCGKGEITPVVGRLAK